MACLSGRPQLHTNTSLLTMEVMISQLTYRVPNFALHIPIILGPHLWVISVEEHRLSHSQPRIYTSRLTMEVLRYRSLLIVYLLLPFTSLHSEYFYTNNWFWCNIKKPSLSGTSNGFPMIDKLCHTILFTQSTVPSVLRI